MTKQRQASQTPIKVKKSTEKRIDENKAKRDVSKLDTETLRHFACLYEDCRNELEKRQQSNL